MRLRTTSSIAASLTAILIAAATLPSIAAPKTPSTGAAPDSKSNPVSKNGIDVTKPYGYHLQPILDKINASAEQREKITQVVMSYKATIQPLREQYKGKQQDFIGSMISGGAAETIMSKQVELGHLSSEITSKYCLMRLEIRRHLTPQQILQFESYGREHGWNK
jgi:Spy/CpxP family protein refolding chaperone